GRGDNTNAFRQGDRCSGRTVLAGTERDGDPASDSGGPGRRGGGVQDRRGRSGFGPARRHATDRTSVPEESGVGRPRLATAPAADEQGGATTDPLSTTRSPIAGVSAQRSLQLQLPVQY